jgi:hypothetical protein
MSWKNVPIPNRLNHLLRDKRGFPIPYVADWTRPENTVDIIHRDGYAIMGCSCRIGVGTPLLGEQCPVRQRLCMLNRRCQVCGRTIRADQPVVFLGRADLPYYIEPPLHKACAAYSVQVCPGMVGRPGVGVTIAAGYTLLDRFEYGPMADVEHVPHGRLPLLVEAGIRRAALTFHAAIPVADTRLTVAEYLTQTPEVTQRH